MKQYLDALQHVIDTGTDKSDRTGVGTRSVFGHQMRFNLQEGFPAVTTKRLAWKSVVSELLWFLEGSTDERRLAEIRYGKGSRYLVGSDTIWTANANFQGKSLGYHNDDTRKMLGPVYGYQFRNFGGEYHVDSQPGESGFDQLQWLISEIQTNPDSRRLVLSTWDAASIHKMALPPCHILSQFVVCDNRLSCQLYQRSCDMGLGVPFNIASYSLLTHIIASICGLDVGEFVWTGGDVHIYNNHLEAIDTQLNRELRPLPTLNMPEITTIDAALSTTLDQYVLENYHPHDTIQMDMSV